MKHSEVTEGKNRNFVVAVVWFPNRMKWSFLAKPEGVPRYPFVMPMKEPVL
jgi:hypothetical protein